MCVCMRTIFSPYFFATALICGMYSYQMPNDDAGPPTFVRCVPPEPRPGLMRTPTLPPREIFPKASSCSSEHAL